MFPIEHFTNLLAIKPSANLCFNNIKFADSRILENNETFSQAPEMLKLRLP